MLPISCSCISQSIASDQETHFTAKEVCNGPMVMEFTIISYYDLHFPEAAGLREWWNGLITVPVKWQFFARLGQSSLEGCVCFESASNIWYHTSKSQDAGVQKSKNRNGKGPFSNTPRDPPATFLLPVPVTLSSAGLESLDPERGMLPPGDTTMTPLNRKLRLPPSHFGFLMSLNQQAKKRVTTLVGLTDPNYEGEIG